MYPGVLLFVILLAVGSCPSDYRPTRRMFCVSAIALGGRFGLDISAVRGLSLVGLR